MLSFGIKRNTASSSASLPTTLPSRSVSPTVDKSCLARKTSGNASQCSTKHQSSKARETGSGTRVPSVEKRYLRPFFAAVRAVPVNLMGRDLMYRSFSKY
ncbi:hypothetical protein XENOCAPTIV_027587 [Xenoophorus captivus]|uniref:Uncharacterized protein n=1 Tax=Xenoophorus captivus TaxID=1517983 RepID=A0ABV0QBP7_9TELE